MRRIGIFGGSFDPIHYGHLHLAEEARCMAKLDQVLFIPTWVSPFKQDSQPASCQQRLEMVRIAIASNPAFAISDMEIRREKVSYTIDTLRRLRKMMGESTRLYFITGTDAFLGIEDWYESDEMLRDYSFLIGTRPGYCQEELDQVIQRVTDTCGADVQKIEIPQLDISSSRIREKVRAGGPVRYLLPDSLLHYIKMQGLYLGETASLPPTFAEIDEKAERLIAERLKPRRLKHTYGVAKEAARLARRYGGDPQKAKTCALLHDAFRETGNLIHGDVAADYMRKEFDIRDEDMLNAVRYHTTGRAGMSQLEKILYLADAIEPNRDYPGVEEVRKAATEDLDLACLMQMNHTIAYLESQGVPVDERTAQAADYLTKYVSQQGGDLRNRCQGKEIP